MPFELAWEYSVDTCTGNDEHTARLQEATCTTYPFFFGTTSLLFAALPVQWGRGCFPDWLGRTLLIKNIEDSINCPHEEVHLINTYNNITNLCSRKVMPRVSITWSITED